MKLETPSYLQTIVNQYFTIISALVVVVILAIGWATLLGPKYQTIQENGGLYYQRSKREYEKKEAYLKDLKVLEQKYNALNHETLDKLRSILPTEQDIPDLLIQLEALTKENNLIMTSIDISETTNGEKQNGVAETNNKKEETKSTARVFDNPNIKTMDITMNVQGIESYAQLKSFLQELETNVRLLDMKAFQYQEGLSVYAFNLSTYYLAE